MPAVVDVWVQLAYREDQNDVIEFGGRSFCIYDFRGRNIDGLIQAVKNKVAEDSIIIPLINTNIYRLNEGVILPSEENETVSLKNCTSLDPDEGLSEIRTSATTKRGKPGPLIVVAPKPQQQQLHQQSVFMIGAVVRGAKQSNGARGNVFKFLERHGGHYSEQEGIQIVYQNDDLHIKAYFLSYKAACQLQTALNEWEIHKELANLRGVSLDPLTPARMAMPQDLTRIYLQHYKPQETESPCQTLDQLRSYCIFVPVTEPAEPNTPLVRYQSIDKLVPHLKHYKCHLKDKAKFQSLHNNENNMIAASWTFHQQLDGLNVEDGMPLAAISVKQVSSCRSATHDDRYSVTLSIQFFYPDLATSFAAPEGARMVTDDDDACSWETVVFVKDKNLFLECIEWKFQDTTNQWQRHREFLEKE
mmetsp:Transcript_33718/g.70103  ORF Transcript_33718/g.70103 Transcript_33718/m.70103 type:complete len:417 (-) Transcript_33718:69-1319(-)